MSEKQKRQPNPKKLDTQLEKYRLSRAAAPVAGKAKRGNPPARIAKRLLARRLDYETVPTTKKNGFTCPGSMRFKG